MYDVFGHYLFDVNYPTSALSLETPIDDSMTVGLVVFPLAIVYIAIGIIVCTLALAFIIAAVLVALVTLYDGAGVGRARVVLYDVIFQEFGLLHVLNLLLLLLQWG
jgi:hypothetical protein